MASKSFTASTSKLEARITELSTSEEWGDRMLIAPYRCLTLETMERLADDPDDDVRAALATNGELPDDLRLKLSRDDAPIVRAAVAGHADTQPHILQSLSYDDAFEVQLALVQNPVTPLPALHRLAHEDDFIRGILLSHSDYEVRVHLEAIQIDPSFVNASLIQQEALLSGDGPFLNS